MKTMRSLKRWEIAILVGIVLMASSAMGAWLVAAEKITVSTAIKSLTSATYGAATTAQLQVEGASIYWSCDPTTFTADSTTGFTANPMTAIWLDSVDKIRNFRAVRSGSTDATLKANYYE